MELTRKILHGRLMKGIEMKKIGSVISLSFLVLFLLVSNVYCSSEWVELYKNDDGDVLLYNKGSIEKGEGEYIFHVWEKVVCSKKSREKFLQSKRESGGSIEVWDKLSEDVSISEIDCKKKMKRTLSTYLYDKDGKLLLSDSPDEPEWKYIIPDSNEDSLRKAVCLNVIGSSDWVEFYTGKMGNVASYKKVIIEGRKKYVVKEVFSDKGREGYIQDRTEKGLSTEGYKKLSNIQSLSKIDCKKKKIMNISVFYFDTDGKNLNSHFVDKPKWVKIPNNSFFNSLLKEVCK